MPQQKMDMLNCLIFDTSFGAWVGLKLSDDDGSEFEATPHRMDSMRVTIVAQMI